MSTYTGVDPRQLARLAADVRQLVDPILVPVRQRVRRRVHWVLVTHPPLLAQLRAACEPGATIRRPERHTGPRSRPAANLDALTALQAIDEALIRWRTRLGAGGHGRADEDALRALVDAAAALAPSIAAELADDAHHWWRHAAVNTGWHPDDLERLR